MPPRPNIFHHATSELSQDAVLAWLVSWADQDVAEHDQAMHQLGLALVAALLRTHGIELPAEPYSVKVETQHERIDVLVRVGDRYLLAIEDKTDTGPHSDQLTRYREIVEPIAASEDRAPVLVYLKTGEGREYAYVRSKGWQPFGRNELLAVIGGSAVSDADNDILRDYVQHLLGIEHEATSWRWKSIDAKWSGHAWAGLYGVLEARLDHGGDLGWDYVPNPTGGFMGLWWGFRSVDGGSLYVQLEEGKLTIKVHVHDKAQRRELREQWSARVLRAAPGADLALRRPDRMGSGKYMTVAVGVEGWRVRDEGGLLDLGRTVERLELVARLVEATTAAS